jgi:hypothetical protein
MTRAGTDVWERLAVDYVRAGSPYGDSQEGLVRWVSEQESAPERSPSR